MDDALRYASRPHDFKLLVSADGHPNTTMEDVDGDAGENDAAVPEAS